MVKINGKVVQQVAGFGYDEAMNKTLPFTKMQALGNDFVMLKHTDVPETSVADQQALAARLCDRKFGIGADGLIIAAPPTDPGKFDVQFIYYNGDGSIAEMCGNGIRAFALFAKEHGYVQQNKFRVETRAGLIQPEIIGDGLVKVDMGPPILEPSQIPFKPTISASAPVKEFPLEVLGQTLPISAVSMGNPHCIVFLNETTQTQWDPAVFGPAMEVHPAFPAKTNVEFVEVLSPNHVKVIVWERGCGFTLACGTGACAVGVAGLLNGKTAPEVTVQLPGGSLQIAWNGKLEDSVWMTGPTAYVFNGTFSV